MSAHPAAYWVLKRQPRTERPDDRGPTGAGEAKTSTIVLGDELSEYPFSGDDVCKLCGSSLSRYNPSVICHACIDRAYDDGSAVEDPRIIRLLGMKRPRNPRHLSVDRSWFDERLVRRGRSGRVRRSARRYE